MIIQVLDNQGKSIGAMKEELVHEQNLLHKRLILLIYREEMICFKKHQDGNDIYDFPVNIHLPIDSSQEELIEKKLEELELKKRLVKSYRQNHFYREKNEFISIYFIKSNKFEMDEFNLNLIYLQRREFDFALRKYPEIFSEYVHWTHSIGVTFSGLS